MSSPEPLVRGAWAQELLGVAREAIAHGLRGVGELWVDPAEHAAALRELGASFVTLRRDGALRGCTGTLEARAPLVCDVARNAHRSAFADPRFPPLERAEFPDLEIHIALLSPAEALPAQSEQELLARLRPGVDGLVLREGPRCATFLPAVWESLPGPRDFVEQLRAKAGLPAGYWSDSLRFERYTVEEVS